MSSLSGCSRRADRDSLEGDHRIERSHLDPNHVGQVENRVQGAVVVVHPAGSLIQIERDDRQLPAEPLVMSNGIIGLGEGQQSVGLSPASFDGHGNVAGTGNQHAIRQRLAPGIEHQPALLRAEVRASSGVSPDRHPAHRLPCHPAGIRALRSRIEISAAKREPVPPGSVRHRDAGSMS